MALVVKLQKQLKVTDSHDASSSVELLARAAIRARGDVEFHRTEALILEQQHGQLGKARKPIAVNDEAVSMAHVMIHDHVGPQQQAKLAADAQIVAEKAVKKAAKVAAKEAKTTKEAATKAIEQGTSDDCCRGGGRSGGKTPPEALIVMSLYTANDAYIYGLM